MANKEVQGPGKAHRQCITLIGLIPGREGSYFILRLLRTIRTFCGVA